MKRHVILAASVVIGAALACDQGADGSSGPTGTGTPLPAPAPQQPQPSPPAEPMPAPPVPTVEPPPPVTIGPGGPGYQVTVGGQDVWPPTGPGCEQLVACCDAAGAAETSITLFCRMSVARQPVDCAAAIGQVRQYLSEIGTQAPPACAP